MLDLPNLISRLNQRLPELTQLQTLNVAQVVLELTSGVVQEVQQELVPKPVVQPLPAPGPLQVIRRGGVGLEAHGQIGDMHIVLEGSAAREAGMVGDGS